MERLRGEDGCPWDREQTYATIKNYLIEEAYETVEAIEDNNFDALCEELGDILLQVVFLSQIASEEKRFTVDDVIEAISTKMVRRHPHVFGEVNVADSNEVLKNWEAMKQAERLEKQPLHPNGQVPSILDGVTRRQPAVLEASQISQRAARVGFDWSKAEEIFEKLNEEIDELHDAIESNRVSGRHPVQAAGDNDSKIEEEIGDIMFVAINLARHFNIDPESALKKTNRKFRNRFRHIETMLSLNKKSFGETTLQEMEHYWTEAKRSES